MYGTILCAFGYLYCNLHILDNITNKNLVERCSVFTVDPPTNFCLKKKLDNVTSRHCEANQ